MLILVLGTLRRQETTTEGIQMGISRTRELGAGPMVLALAALALLVPAQSEAKPPKVWHSDFVTWAAGSGPHGSEAGSCRITFYKGIACAQNFSPDPDQFSTVNLKSTGKPFVRIGQKFPSDRTGRQIYKANQARWSRNGVNCRLNLKGGVKCSNGHWAFVLNTDSYRTFKLK